jgi:hypothetical protein
VKTLILTKKEASKLVARRPKTGRKIACSGQAHTNGFIDHCALCLGGEWGKVDELGLLDLKAVRKSHRVVLFGELTDDQIMLVDADVLARLADEVEVEIGGTSTRGVIYR